MERVILLFIALFFSAQSSLAQIAVVSDLDETIKRTGISNPARGLYNALFTQNIFFGMDTLFEEMDAYASDLFIISASPNLFRFNILKLLRKHDIEPIEVYTRRGLENKFWYKYDAIKETLSRGYEKIILIGDDLQEDPQIYDRIKQDFPDKVLAIYIHKVAGKKLPDSSTAYLTSYDLALLERAAGRLSLSETWNLGEAVLEVKDYKSLFPTYAFCPTEEEQLLSIPDEELRDLTGRIGQKIVNYCRRLAKID